MKEDPDKEKEALSTVINHPTVPFLPESFRLVDSRNRWDGGIESLEALKATTLCLVALEVCWLGGVSTEFHIGLGSVGEVETIGGHYRLMKQVQ